MQKCAAEVKQKQELQNMYQTHTSSSGEETWSSVALSCIISKWFYIISKFHHCYPSCTTEIYSHAKEAVLGLTLHDVTNGIWWARFGCGESWYMVVEYKLHDLCKSPGGLFSSCGKPMEAHRFSH
jgi:hypothetical protein